MVDVASFVNRPGYLISMFRSCSTLYSLSQKKTQKNKKKNKTRKNNKKIFLTRGKKFINAFYWKHTVG